MNVVGVGALRCGLRGGAVAVRVLPGVAASIPQWALKGVFWMG